ncbi:MAG: N-(5'-phosphoribosyl)anthranilate isomerase [Litoreibacter sp.]|nr:N-(5'-phosphoribosyl)anthranilate isomerase [Litoreibacter sp.]MCY4336452.1 N-(5'-phosphoribosyl)anthranilate isomerase [Litoreibacter sp.]
MVIPNPSITPDIWFAQIFSSKAAQRGGIVRRSVSDVERIFGRQDFEDRIRRRGWRAIENGGQYVICCNREAIRLIE